MKDLLTDFKTSSESINYEARIHWISYVIPVFFIVVGIWGIFSLLINFNFGIIGIISLFLAFLFVKGIIKIIRNKNTKIYIMDNYLTFSTGILGKIFSDISLSKLEGIQLNQSFLGKMLNFGTLVVTTGEVTHSYVIENPMEFRNALIHSQKAV